MFKGIIASAVLLGLLCSGSAASASEGWFNIRPGYDARQKHSTLRIEGGSKSGNGINAYGFSDMDATEQDPYDVENLYSEFRLAYPLRHLPEKAKNVGVAVEYNGGTETKDILRFGLTYTPQTGENNFTLFKFLPFETSGEKGPQISLLTSQKLTDRLTVVLLGDYNFNSRTFYLEPEIDVKLTDNATGFVQGRGSVSRMDEIETPAVAGIKCNF
jgi:hypothetical protein